jgi:RNA polymerase sigma factor (sigma-70 family)
LDHGAFAERLKRVPGSASVPCLQRFDARNELHVDEAARHLLERFREHGDIEAFTLLFELTHERLSESAGRITRKLAPSVDADELASAFMVRLFTDVGRRPGEPVRHFLALAHTSMRNDVLDHLRQQKRAQANQRTWHATQAQPADPADELQAREHEHLLTGFGSEVLALAGECFAELEPRDQQVLVAREIVRLPYERVAALLGLQPDQVGMIIRRARVHLAERLVQRLPDSVRRHQVAPSAAAELLASVREALGSREGVKAVKGLMQRMLEQSVAAARAKLADLVYEMAKACLVQAPGFASRTLIRAEPRRSDVVAEEVRRIARRLKQADAEVDVGRVPLTHPAPATALDDARACLQKLSQIEGRTGRQQVAVALCHIHAGEPAAAESLLAELLLREDLPPVTRQNAARNLQLAQLRLERYDDALATCDAHADEWPEDPVRVMNTCFAAARLSDTARFERAARDLAGLQRHAPSERVADWLAHLLPALARDLGLPDGRVAELLDSTGLPDGDGTRPAETGHAST